MRHLDSIAARIKYARNLSGLNRNGFSKKVDISANTLQSWELGRTSLTKKGAQRFCNALLKIDVICTTKWLLEGDGNIPFIQESKLYAFENDHENNLMREVEIFKSLHPNHLVATVSDIGMLPFYDIADYVGGISILKNDNIYELIGHNCIIVTNENITYIRRLMPGKNNREFTLYALNFDHTIEPLISNVKIKNVAKIIWHRVRN